MPKADEIDRRLDFPPLRLVEQRAGPKAADLAPAQQVGGEGDGPAGVDDVVDEQNVPAFDIARRVAHEAHLAAAHRGEAVAREPHELDLGPRAGAIQGAGEIGDEDECALEQSHHDEIVGKGRSDLAGERLDARRDLRFAQKNA